MHQRERRSRASASSPGSPPPHEKRPRGGVGCSTGRAYSKVIAQVPPEDNCPQTPAPPPPLPPPSPPPPPPRRPPPPPPPPPPPRLGRLSRVASGPHSKALPIGIAAASGMAYAGVVNTAATAVTTQPLTQMTSTPGTCSRNTVT